MLQLLECSPSLEAWFFSILSSPSDDDLPIEYSPSIEARVSGKQGSILLITNQYPDHDAPYQNMFVHNRVKAYQRRGIFVEVFVLKDHAARSEYFEDVIVTRGPAGVLKYYLASERHNYVVVHVVREPSWKVLSQFMDKLKITAWVHGWEFEPWYRRKFNYRTKEEETKSRWKSGKRMVFVRSLTKAMSENLHFVFISKTQSEEVFEDTEYRLAEDKYSIIHNSINTELFEFIEKPVEQRKRILSIRPFHARTYANDLSVKALLMLSKKEFFKDLEIKIIGEGWLFVDTLRPLRELPNISIQQKFLTPNEIASLHKRYGLFLCPTRRDTQGVLRDEAMASGLVPITNAVAAIPEFVDESCGILAAAEDARALAAGIEKLYHDPETFTRMSKAAARRVREQSAEDIIIDRELALIGIS